MVMVMAQILDPLPDGKRKNLLCCYVNASSQIQIARITNIANWYFERVVFPGQRLVFEAVVGSLLEIHSGMMASAILSDTIPAERLAIAGDEDDEFEDEFEEVAPAAIAVNSDLIAVDHKQPLTIRNHRQSQTEIISFSSLNPAFI